MANVRKEKGAHELYYIILRSAISRRLRHWVDIIFHAWELRYIRKPNF